MTNTKRDTSENMTTTRERALEAALRDLLAKAGDAANYLHNLGIGFDFHMDDEKTERCKAIVLAASNSGEAARAALALPPSQRDSVNADMLAALRMAHHALEGRERKDVALDAVAAVIARATS